MFRVVCSPEESFGEPCIVYHSNQPIFRVVLSNLEILDQSWLVVHLGQGPNPLCLRSSGCVARRAESEHLSANIQVRPFRRRQRHLNAQDVPTPSYFFFKIELFFSACHRRYLQNFWLNNFKKFEIFHFSNKYY